MQIAKPWLASRARKPGTAVDTVVLHATAGESLSGAIGWLRKIGLSYHYVIGDGRRKGDYADGEVVKLVPYTREAFHAGVSFGPQGSGVNRYSIGICADNRNDGREPWTDAQVGAAITLIRELRKAVPSLRYLTTHYAVSPGRKSDPRLCPVYEIAEASGLSVWPGGLKQK